MNPRVFVFLTGISVLASGYAGMLIVNPSFEEPVVGPGANAAFTAGQTIGAGWIVQSAAMQTVVNDRDFTGGGVVWAPPTDGRQSLYLGNGGLEAAIYQDLNLVGGEPYRLTFDLASFLGGWDIGAQVSVDLFEVGSLASAVGGGHTFTRPHFSDFATQQMEFTVPSTADYRLVVSGPNGFGNNLDNFSLTAVPEPGTCGLLAGLGLAAFAVFRRARA